MRLLKFFPLFAGLLWSFYGNTAGAATSVISCHNCSWAQYKQQAIASVPANGKRNLAYVVDRTNRRLALYSIKVGTAEGMSYQRVQSLTPSSTDLATFEQDLAELDEFRTAMLVATALPAHFPVFSAAEVYNNNQALLQVQDWVNGKMLINTYLALSHSFGSKLLENFTADVKVVFPDGSTAIFHVDRLEFSGLKIVAALKYSPGTAIGPEGNLLPDTAADLPGYQAEFRIEASVNAMLTRMRLLGISVTGAGGGSGVTQCVYSGEKLICTVQPL